jgi:hypothetical protein
VFPNLSLMNPIQTFLLCFLKIQSKTSFHLRLGLPSGLFCSVFPNKFLYAFIIYSMHVTCPAHLILFDLIILIKFGEQYKLWSSSLYSFLHSPQHPVLTHRQSVFFQLNVKFHTHTKQGVKSVFCVF